MSDFKHKWFNGSRQITELKQTPTEYVFSLLKALVRHDTIDASQSWMFFRLGKNVFLLTPKNPDDETREILKRLGL